MLAHFHLRKEVSISGVNKQENEIVVESLKSTDCQ